MLKERISILDFEDYRDYIKHVMDEYKVKNKSHSFKRFSNKTGLSKSYLKMISDKKRHVSIDNLFVISDHFGLNEEDVQIIIAQILAATSKSKKAKNYFNSVSKTFKAFNSEIKAFNYSDDRAPFFKYNINSILIFILMHSKSFKYDIAWIQNILGGKKIISEKEIEACLLELQNEKLISIDANSNLKINKGNLFNDLPPWDDNQTKSLIPYLLKAIDAISVNNNDLHTPNRFHAYALGVSLENYKSLIKKYDQFKVEIEELTKKNQETEKIIIISNNIFSVSKIM